jgi:outer membrane immunogenic protein
MTSSDSPAAGRRSLVRCASIALGIIFAAAGNARSAFHRSVYQASGDSWTTTRWDGPYVGVNAGGAVGDSALRTAVDPRTANYFLPADVTQIGDAGLVKASPIGFTGGVQAGYNVQVSSVVFGFEADFDSLDLNDSRTVNDSYTSAPTTSFRIQQTIRTDWLLTARPRVGYAIRDFLVYATGGVAMTRLKYMEQFTDTFGPVNASDSFSQVKVGWTAGAGVEYMLRKHWTVKCEYLYADFGSMSNRYTPPPLTGTSAGDQFIHTANLNVHLLRLGLNYKF